MGIFADFLANAKSIDNTPAITALDRATNRELNHLIADGDATLPGAGVNEVQTLSSSGASAGTFDIAIAVQTDLGPIYLDVVSIAYDAAPAAIQTALDTEADGTIPGYTDGDIAVTGAGTAEANDTVFTYSGASVAEIQHPLSTVDGSGLTGGGSEAFAETLNGQPNVYAGIDEIQTLTASGASAGTFDISIGVQTDLGPVFVDVTSIAFDETPANIQTALDTAAGSAVTGYTDGDIAVAGQGTADLNDTVFTYSGTPVTSRQHPLSTVDGGSLTGGGSESFAETEGGQPARNVWAIFAEFNLVDFGGTPPTIGGSLPTLTQTIDRSTSPFSNETLRAFALEAEIQDRIPGLEAALLAIWGLSPLPPASSQG